MVSTKSLLLALAFGAEAFAQANPSTTCSTQLGTVSQKTVSTKVSTSTTTITQTNKVTKTNVQTITPAPTTTTTTSTKIVTETKTAGPATKTATVFVTSTYNTLEIRDLGTTTVTSYSNVERFGTITMPITTPAGFTPISKEPGYVAKRDLSRIEKRAGTGKAVSGAKQYPQRVDCIHKVTKTTTKATTTTVNGIPTTLKPATKAATATVTQTETKTEFPADVSETITSTSYTTITTTKDVQKTSTTTVTRTVQGMVPVYTYEACANDNVVSTANGGQVISNLYSFGTISTVEKYTPYDCCAVCQETANCQGSAVRNNLCYIFTSNRCAPGQYLDFTFKTTPSGGVWTLSNGPCGMIRNDGRIN